MIKKNIEEKVIPLVAKPGRYVGNEINVIKKDWSKVDVSVGLIFPDLYELGMSYIGYAILYHILNRQSYVVAERIFAPGVDLEEILKERSIPLFSLESKRPLRQFDLLGFTLQYELHYTNILNIISLGGINLHARDRGEDEPLILAGGPCAFNPEPLTDFIDAFVIGDGEEVVLEITQFIKKAKGARLNRQEKLRGLAEIAGVYVPQFYSGEKIRSRIIENLDPRNYPDYPLIPLIETTHDRYSLEIMRGCTRGCRFCNAGIIYRPNRELTVQQLVSKAVTVINNTGYDEISLLSLSTSDYSQLQELLKRLTQAVSKKMVNVAFPSLRAETFNAEIAKYAKLVKKSGITLAPEAGTDTLRRVINKNNTNDDLLRAVTVAFEEGWNLVKLYFMIGLPAERDEDLEGIVSLVNQVVAIAKKFNGKNINVSISPFSPKPHTPFQWVAQNSIEELRQKISFLKQHIKSRYVKLSWREPEVAFLEAVMGRGDRRLNEVIFKAWELGAKFDGWSDHFKFDIWKLAFEQSNINPQEFVGARNLDEELPWEHIDIGITKSFLKREFKKAFKPEETPDCKTDGCNACGLMKHQACQAIIHQQKPSKVIENAPAREFGRTKKLIRPTTTPTIRHLRLKYSKGEEIRFTSHLDLIRIFERTFRRANIKLVYTQGFHPHPKISYGPPLTMGYTSEAEYLDIQLLREQEINLSFELNKKLPAGLKILDSKMLIGKYNSLTSIINRAEYKVILHKTFDQSYLNQKIAEFLNRSEILVERIRKGGSQQIDIRPFIENIEVDTYPHTIFLSTIINQGQTVRVSEILGELLSLSDEEIAIARITRMGLYVKSGDEKLTPLEI